MDLNRLNDGERIAGIGGVVLLISLWLSWYGVPGVADVAGIDTTANAWQSFDLIDIILFLTAVVAIGAALLSASGEAVSLPVAASSVVAGMGALSVLLVLYRIINPPGPGEADLDLKFGIFVGLLAAGAVAYGGYRGMQEDAGSGTFSDVPR